MKYRIFIALALIACGAAACVAAETPNDSINIAYTSPGMTPRVVVRGDDGTFPSLSAIDSSNSIVMTLTDNGYVARGVDINTGGFLFYAPFPSDSKPQEQWEKLYFTMPDWAEHPVLMRYLNPLFRVFTSQNPSDVCIEMPQGTYDIYFFTRKQQEDVVADQYYELFSIVNSNDPEPSDQPEELYIIDQYNTAIRLPRSGSSEYRGEVVLPADGFKICYQSMGFYIPAFIFGPKTTADSSLKSGDECLLTYGWNTYQPFTYATDVAEESKRLEPGMKAIATVTLQPGDDRFTIERTDYVTGVEDVSVDAGGAPQYYTLSGIPVSSPAEGSVYIRRYPDGHTDKVFKF